MDFAVQSVVTRLLENGLIQSGLVSGVLASLNILFSVLSLATKDRPFPKTSSTFKEEYDYVIVGGGTAGSVMANRLSQKPCVSVLLLEAGAEAPIFSDVPSFPRVIYYQSEIDWAYRTVPQKYCSFGQIENRVIWNSGKALGGGSVLNSMLYVRGNMKNYDDWEREGATGWSYRDVLPYFLKLEDNRNIKELDPGFHRKGGPVTVEKPKYTPEIKNPILAATAELGYQLTDINGRRQTGIYDLQATLRNSRRCSTAKAYLVPAEDRPNLDILPRAFVRKILIKNKRAYGVVFDFGGKTRTVYARKEVIISAGTIRTPQILMLSGIGPREHLKKFKIPVVKELPVGKNLQDHCSTNVNFLLSRSIKPVIVKNLSPISLLDFVINGAGPLAAPTQCTLLAFLDGLNTTAFSRDFPRQELYFVEYSTVDAKRNFNMKPEVYQQIYGPYEGLPIFTCMVSLLKPHSRGEILLNSTDPYDPPLINPNYYQDERDLRDVVEGMKICQAVGRSPQMKKVQARPFATVYPGCEKYVGYEDLYLACQARTVVTSYWHSVGTARMGQPHDPRSVVDPQLRVIGIKGLRVINAAVMPIIPSGNTNIPTIMVAEKAYDMMKNDVLCHGERIVKKSRKKILIPQVPSSIWNIN